MSNPRKKKASPKRKTAANRSVRAAKRAQAPETLADALQPADTAKLTPKDARFVEEYLIDLNASAAARRAGFKKATAGQVGHELLKKPEIAAAIAQARARMSEALEVTRTDIAKELHKMGFANMLSYLQVTESGDAYVDLSALDRDRAAAIQEVTVEDYVDGRGEDARDVRKVRVKLSDKRAALMSLAELLNLVPPKRLDAKVDAHVRATALPPTDQLEHDEIKALRRDAEALQARCRALAGRTGEEASV